MTDAVKLALSAGTVRALIKDLPDDAPFFPAWYAGPPGDADPAITLRGFEAQNHPWTKVPGVAVLVSLEYLYDIEDTPDDAEDAPDDAEAACEPDVPLVPCEPDTAPAPGGADETKYQLIVTTPSRIDEKSLANMIAVVGKLHYAMFYGDYGRYYYFKFASLAEARQAETRVDKGLDGTIYFTQVAKR